METITLNVYDDKGEVIKTVSNQPTRLKFGAIRSLMKLLNIENVSNNYDLMNTIYEAWDKLTAILNQCFPEMTEEDWDNVAMEELIPVIVKILKTAFAKILEIPKDPKN